MSKNEFDGYEKVEDEIFKFENVGDFVVGKYIAKETSGNFDNEVYKIQKESGDVVTVFATTVLQSIMNSIELGTEVVIRLTGVKPNPKKNLNDIKLFEVLRKK